MGAHRCDLTPELASRARAWIEADPDPQTRDELAAVVARATTDGTAVADLADRMAGTLAFGTAGLRGPMGAGSNRMNHAVVTRATAGLCAWLDTTGTDRPLVIGFDARHRSAAFAEAAAGVSAATGRETLLLPGTLPTPVLAFNVHHLGAAAGVMITASHNPAGDNGYKVYLADGAQLAPPVDAGVAAAIEQIGPAREVPTSNAWRMLDEQTVDEYVDAVAALAMPGPRELRVAFTPLHGVGGTVLPLVLDRAGFAAPRVVGEQALPNPDFPTVAFPNPEEPGVMDLVIRLAEDTRADLAIAIDPDGDRCAVAVPDVAGWRRLSGDELGTLLADLSMRTTADSAGADHDARGVFATSIVSSRQLAALAAARGRRSAETLTGFKWLARVPGLAYAYEEAIGYCVAPQVVRDKDGISAALLVCALAAALKADGRTLLDRLDDLARETGLFVTGQTSQRYDGTRRLAAEMARIRGQSIEILGGLRVRHVDDLARPGGSVPPTVGLRLSLEGDGRVVVRPSGTEPKVKCYLEVVDRSVGADTSAAELVRRRHEAQARLDAIAADVAELLRG